MSLVSTRFHISVIHDNHARLARVLSAFASAGIQCTPENSHNYGCVAVRIEDIHATRAAIILDKIPLPIDSTVAAIAADEQKVPKRRRFNENRSKR